MLDPRDRIETLLMVHVQEPDGCCRCGFLPTSTARWRRHVADLIVTEIASGRGA